MAMTAALRKRIREEFPAYAYLLDNSEVASVLGRAITEGWDPGKLQANLMKTRWWKTTNEVKRNWQTLQKTDPAEAKRQFMQRLDEVEIEAARLGVAWKGWDLLDITNRSLANGWESSRITQMIARLGAKRGFRKSGELRRTAQDMRAIAKEYALNISDATLRSWAVKIASGSRTEEGLRAWMQNKAKDTYGAGGKNLTLIRGLDSGLSVRDIYGDVIETVAGELEIDPSRVDLTTGRWGKLLEFQADDGMIRPMTKTEAVQWSRGQKEWTKTTGAKEATFALADGITAKFGLRKA